MTTSASAAFGTTIAKGATAIAEVTNISGPGVSADMLDASSHDSADTFREFLAGVKDGGEITLDFLMVPGDAGQAALYTDACDGSSDAYTITYSDGGAATWTFNALVSSFGPISASYDGLLTNSATLKVTGKPVFAA